MKNYDVLCFGACVIDQRENTSSYTLGGDAANQALILKRLGFHPVLCAAIGKDDTGNTVKEILHHHGISTEYLIENHEWTTTLSTIHLDEMKERSFTVTGGAHRLLDKQHFPLHQIPSCRAISLGSMFTLHLLEEDGLLDIFQKAKAHQCITFCDTSTDRHHKGLKKVKEFLPYIDYFMPSYDEAAALTGKTDPDEIAHVLFQHGANTVIVKLGSQGANLYHKESKIHVDAYDALVIDTTGAGDHFCAGFIASILSGLSEEKALHNACWLGARATESYGTNNTQFQTLPFSLK